MKIKATDLVDAIVAMDKAMAAVIEHHVPGTKWMDIAGELSASKAALKRSLRDASVEVEAVQA